MVGDGVQWYGGRWCEYRESGMVGDNVHNYGESSILVTIIMAEKMNFLGYLNYNY